MSEQRRGWPYEPVGGPPPPPPPTDAIEGPPLPQPPPPEPALSRRALVLLSIAGATALLLAAVGVGDWWVRNQELRTLLERVERAERAQLPAIQTISPLLFLCEQEATGDDEDDLCDTAAIQAGAQRTLPRLQQTGEEVANTRLTSYHGKLRAFRDTYVEHNLAWRSWLESLARDPTAGNFESPENITSTFYAASDAADEALTPLPLHGNRERIERIFESIR